MLTWVVFGSSWPRIPGLSIYRNVASEPGACPARTGRNMTRDNEPKLARASSSNSGFQATIPALPVRRALRKAHTPLLSPADSIT
ncbi:hypothetical protein SKAU_G00158650 [Synaphobranchus kaupii]|uniref:Uncharacterized protein n=1 Tax=Synaphobranchus kaupii TaxID=118154 RepID=A0A9Q1IZJ1_SYNKA|nr:hypothetical protein SKAU_G00158650 [Synaphobranchus kaupii]